MLLIPNLALWSDVAKLPKEVLKDICLNLDQPNTGTIDELSERIWREIGGNPRLQVEALQTFQDRLFGGKTSVVWYRLDLNEIDLVETLGRTLGFNPYEEMRIPPVGQITATPVLIGASIGNQDHEHYTRFIHKTGIIKNFYGTEMQTRPKTSTNTVYLNKETGIVEIRTDPKNAEKIADSLAGLMQQRIALERVDVAAPFGNNVEEIADALGGELFDAEAKPELLLENFTEEQANAVVQILTALDSYFDDDDLDALQDNLAVARGTFGTDMLAVPFTALILNGLDKIGMGVTGRDLRGLPLYDFLKPHLQSQGGYIEFPVNEQGVVKHYTIRVGLKANSIQFVSHATEGVIQYVRERIIRL